MNSRGATGQIVAHMHLDFYIILDMVIGIILGLLIWLVGPLLFHPKKKGVKAAINKTCAIIGIAIIIVTLIRYFIPI